MRAAKERKQKKLAIVLGVVLLAVVGFQAPRIMKMFKGDEVVAAPAVVPTTAPTTPAGPVSLQPPTLAGGGAAPAGGTPAPGSLPGSEVAPLASSGQLISFSRFESKDPFAQQLEDIPAPQQSGGTGTPSGKGAAKGGKQNPPATTTVARAAVISVNGAKETVSPGGGFPAASPLFTLVSLTKTSAAVAIAGGSYADGAKTVQLRRGETLTLMNTADGVRYELKLVSLIWGSAPQS
jgi:hypothetical protein